MAIRPCKECGKDMSTTAAACPHCGAKQKRTSGFTWIIAVFLGLMVFAWINISLDRDQRAEATAAKAAALTPAQRDAAKKHAALEQATEKQQRDEAMVAYACKDWVKKSLHDPESARFEESFAFNRKAAYDQVQVRVRARNAFNATRLSTFECRIRQNAGAFTLVGMQELQ